MMLYPERRFFLASQVTETIVAIQSSPLRDLYVVYAGQSPDTGTPVIHAYLNPLVKWIWFGGIVVVLGTLLALVPNRRAAIVLRSRRPKFLGRSNRRRFARSGAVGGAKGGRACISCARLAGVVLVAAVFTVLAAMPVVVMAPANQRRGKDVGKRNDVHVRRVRGFCNRLHAHRLRLFSGPCATAKGMQKTIDKHIEQGDSDQATSMPS